MQPDSYSFEANRYMECMKEISLRIKNLKDIFSTHGIPTDKYNIEYVCLNFRVIAETIFMSNYTANSKDFEMADKISIETHKHGEIRKATLRKNMHYYPRPVDILDISADGEIRRNVTVKEGVFITEMDLVDIWRRCSNFLHAINPFQEPKDYLTITKSFEGWVDKICELLQNHITTLSVGEQYFVCSVPFDKSDDVIKLIHAGDFT